MLNRASSQPGMASLIVGASKLGALVPLTKEQNQLLSDVSAIPVTQPYMMFSDKQIHGVACSMDDVQDKPPHYYRQQHVRRNKQLDSQRDR